MEEFRSTEILDKEIQADARKKAEKILAKADVDCALLLEEVSGKIEKAKKELEDKYALKIAAFEKDLSATLPLEKERFLVSFIQSSIEKAINAYLAKLSDEEKIDLVLKKSVKIEDVLKSKFGALYHAFQFGAPPHAGMAPGVDRMIMLLREEENIREVIAFPMNGNAEDLMCGAPGKVTEQQLREAHIKIRD